MVAVNGSNHEGVERTNLQAKEAQEMLSSTSPWIETLEACVALELEQALGVSGWVLKLLQRHF